MYDKPKYNKSVKSKDSIFDIDDEDDSFDQDNY